MTHPPIPAASPANNMLLARIPAGDMSFLSAHLRPLNCEPEHLLYEAGDHVQTIYFPLGPTTVSFQVAVKGSSRIEIIQVGSEGAVGGIVSQGRMPAFCRIIAQAASQPGGRWGAQFLTLPVDVLEAAKLRSRELDNLFARYADCLLAQVFQASACNAAHQAEERAAKWLIASLARSGGDEVQMTQERLAAMLGVGRSYVARLLGIMRREGIVSMRRGVIVVHDSARLRQQSCNCDEIVARHFDRVLGQPPLQTPAQR